MLRLRVEYLQKLPCTFLKIATPESQTKQTRDGMILVRNAV